MAPCVSPETEFKPDLFDKNYVPGRKPFLTGKTNIMSLWPGNSCLPPLYFLLLRIYWMFISSVLTGSYTTCLFVFCLCCVTLCWTHKSRQSQSTSGFVFGFHCCRVNQKMLTQTLIKPQCDIHLAIIYRYSYSNILLSVYRPEEHELWMHSHNYCMSSEVAKNASPSPVTKERCHFGFPSEPFLMGVVITACRPLGISG